MVDATRQLGQGWSGWQTASTATLTGRVEPITADVLERYRRFAEMSPCGTGQLPAWAEGWMTHAAADGFMVSVATGQGTCLMLPLEVLAMGPFRVARFLGGKHANASFPALAPDAQDELPDLSATLARAVRESRPDVDLLLFDRLAAEQEGRRNPLLAPRAVESPNLALSVSLSGGFDAVLGRADDRRKAKKHRKRTREFEAAGGFQRIEARDVAEVERQLDFFFTCKRERFEEAGIPDAFGDAKTQSALIHTFTRALDEARPSFVLYGLEVGGKLRAVSAHSVVGKRITCEFATFAQDELFKLSPGQFLFHLNIEEACRLGFDSYDFGVGDEPYKRLWCDVETTHWDVMVPVTVKGRALANALGAVQRGKRAIKRNPALWNAFKQLRRRAAGRSTGETADGTADN